MKSKVNITYLGGPTVFLETDGLRLIDAAGEMFMINDKPAYWKTEGPAIII